MVTTIQRRASAGLSSDQVSVRLAPHEITVIDELVASGFFLNRSDFLRYAARQTLQATKVETVRPLSRKEAEKEILDHLKVHPGAYPSDIAAERGIDLALTMEVVQDLLSRRKVEEAGHAHASGHR